MHVVRIYLFCSIVIIGTERLYCFMCPPQQLLDDAKWQKQKKKQPQESFSVTKAQHSWLWIFSFLRSLLSRASLIDCFKWFIAALLLYRSGRRVMAHCKSGLNLEIQIPNGIVNFFFFVVVRAQSQATQQVSSSSSLAMIEWWNVICYRFNPASRCEGARSSLGVDFVRCCCVSVNFANRKKRLRREQQQQKKNDLLAIFKISMTCDVFCVLISFL